MSIPAKTLITQGLQGIFASYIISCMLFYKENRMLNVDFDLKKAVRETATKGYFFASNAFSSTACQAIEVEVGLLNLEEGDHITKPINAGTGREVRQLHARAYLPLG